MRYSLFLCLLFTAQLLTGCRGCNEPADSAVDDSVFIGPADTAEGVDTADTGCETEPDEVRSILADRCYACHGEGGVAEGGLNYALDYDRLIENGLVVPEDTEGSLLYQRIVDGSMPPVGAEPISDDEIVTIKDWIACGAEGFEGQGGERAFIEDATVHDGMAVDLDGVELHDPTSTPYIRYVGLVHLYNAGVSDDELETYRFGLAKLLNALSRGPDVTNPAPVALDDLETAADDDDNNDELLFRIDLRDYGWTANDEDPVDGWEHLLKDYPLGFDYGHPDGHDDALYRQLQERTGSRQPLINGDWLVWAAATPPLYHDILRAPETLDDFLDDFGVHRQDDIDALTAQRAGFAESGVAQENRLIERHPADGGYCWIAYDADTSHSTHNIFNYPLDFVHDGAATLCALPNGLSAYLLTDADGARSNAADTHLFLDPGAEDGEAVNGLSCMRCHVDGVNPATDEVREYVEGVESTGQFSVDELETIYALYPGADAISDLIIADAADFQDALAQTGAPEMTTDSTVALSGAFERDLSARRAAAELGLTEKDFQDRLLYLPDAFQDLKPLTDETDAEQTVRRETFLGLARELRCYLDTLIEPEDPADSFCLEPGAFNQTAVACLDGQGLVEAGEDEGACITCADGTTRVTWYTDGDGDGYGPADWADAIASCEPVDEHVDYGGDCDDDDPAYHPYAHEECDEDIDYNCDGSTGYEDVDGDGEPACTDCNDSDHEIHAGADEVCDGEDNDCDDAFDEDALDALTWHADADLDGYADELDFAEACAPGPGAIADDGSLEWDCDDDDPLVHPATVWYADGDLDGYGLTGAATIVCERPPWTSLTSGDCDDADPAVNPEGAEVCDEVDNDCDDPGHDDVDNDADGYIDEADEFTGEGVDEAFDRDDAVDNDGDGLIDEHGEILLDGYDDDGDGVIDESGEARGDQIVDAGSASDAALWYLDADGDGHGDASESRFSCAQPSGYVADSGDCGDADPAISPSADELCTPAGAPAALDEDCDGLVDESGAIDASTWYADADGDGYGDPDVADVECYVPTGYVSDGTDCDDAEATAWPGAPEVCDGALDEDCDGAIDEEGATDAQTWYADDDADGYRDEATSDVSCDQPSGYLPASAAEDCDDHRAEVNPTAPELCDGILDEDCDGRIDEETAFDASTWYADADGDSYGDPGSANIECAQPPGFVADGTDCDDTSASHFPGATEVCDSPAGAPADEDCDGAVDESGAADAGIWYADADGDGYGDPDDAVTACADPDGEGPSGYLAEAGDCDDGDAAVNPAAVEICDDLDVDEDCDGGADDDDPDGDAAGTVIWADDLDGDGYGADDPDGTLDACDAPLSYVVYSAEEGDCDDLDDAVHPGAVEVCDDADTDEDCDGLADDDDEDLDPSGKLTWAPDSDGDGYTDDGATQISNCDDPGAYEGEYLAESSGDCDDGDAGVNPAADELCGGADEDCDGSVDESTAADAPIWYADTDADGYGDPGSTDVECEAPAGYTSDDTDCDDVRDDVHPGAEETCDGTTDEDCDGDVDESGAADVYTWYPDADGDGYGDADAPVTSCEVLTGYTAVGGDCDDGDAGVNPDAEEILGNEIDEDCDGAAYCDPNNLRSTGGATFDQSEVDTFCDDYDAVSGTMILDSDVDDLSGLSCLCQVTALNITDTALTSLEGLDALTLIDGGLTITSNDALTSVEGIGALTTISGSLIVKENVSLSGLDGFDSLTTIGSSITLEANDVLTDAGGFPALKNVGAGIEIRDLDALVELGGFPVLEAVGGTFYIHYNDSLETISGLGELQTVGDLEDTSGSLYLDHNDALQTISGLGALQAVGSWFRVSYNKELTALDGFGSLTEIGGHLYIHENQLLNDIDGFSALHTIAGELDIHDNAALTSVTGFDALTSIGTFLSINDNLQLEDVDFDALVDVGSKMSIEDLVAADLDGFTALETVGGDLEIQYNPGIEAISGLTSLQSVSGQLQIYQNVALRDLVGLNAVTSLGELYIYNNDALIEIDALNALEIIAGDVDITDNDALETFHPMEWLATIEGGLTLNGNHELTNLTAFSALTEIDGQLYLSSHDALLDLMGLEALGYIGGDLEITSNDGLLDLAGLGTLTDVGGSLEIKNCDALLDLTGLDGLEWVGGEQVWIYDNLELESLTGLGTLTTVVGDLFIDSNSDNAMDDLTGLDALETVGGDLNLKNNDGLQSLSGLDSLITVSGGLYIHSNDKVNDLSALSRVTGFSESLYIFDNDQLSTLDGLQGVGPLSGDLTISTNYQLLDISALTGITGVEGDLTIFKNLVLPSLTGLENLSGELSSLDVDHNDLLANISALGGLSGAINGPASITWNDALASLAGLGGIVDVFGALSIEDNGSLPDLSGLDGLEEVHGNLTISENAALSSLSGLGALEEVDADLVIEGHVSLTSLDGLNALVTVRDDLDIDENAALTDVTALHDNLKLVYGDLIVTDNTSLVTADAQALYDAILAKTGSYVDGVTISGNAP